VSFEVRKIAIAADTAVQIAGPTLTASTHVRTANRSVKIKLNFIPTAGAAVVTINNTSASAVNGYPLANTDDADPNVFEGGDDIQLTAGDSLWLYATVAGTVYVLTD
jgi:hypothetical protein